MSVAAGPVPVVLVHGMASSFELNWREPGWIDLLADAGRPVVGVDLLGHGTAPKPHDPAEYTHLEDRVLEALPAEGQVDAVGFSLGAQTLLRAVVARPERFRRVVLAGIGGGVFEGSTGNEALARALETGEADEPGGVTSLLAQFAQHPDNDPAALAACARAPRPGVRAEDLAAVTCPVLVLVVIGDKDFVGPADPLVDALPDARLRTLRNTEHFATPRSFDFIDATLAFLDAVPA